LSQTSKYAIGIILVAICLVVGMIGGAIGSKLSTPGTKAGFASPLWLVTMNDTTVNRAFNTSYLNSGSEGNVMTLQIFLGLNHSEVDLYISRTQADVHNSTATGILVNNASNLAVMEFTAYIPWGYWYELNNTPLAPKYVYASIYQWLESVPPTGFGQMIAPEIMSIRRF